MYYKPGAEFPLKIFIIDRRGSVYKGKRIRYHQKRKPTLEEKESIHLSG